MHDGILVTIRNTCQFRVPVPNRAKAFVDVRTLQWNLPPLAELFSRGGALAIEARRFGVFVLVQHWHFMLTPPAPEHFHDHPTFAGQRPRLKFLRCGVPVHWTLGGLIVNLRPAHYSKSG